MKATLDFAEEFGGGLQVDTSRIHVDMAHIRGQQREPGVDVPAVSIPSQQAVYGEGMSKVVETRPGVPMSRDAAFGE